MIERLAQSVEEIVQGCSSHLEFRRKRCAAPHSAFARHLASPPSCICIYFDLLQAVRRDDLDACARLLERDGHSH